MIKKILTVVFSFTFLFGIQNIQAKELNKEEFIKILKTIQVLKTNPIIIKNTELFNKLITIEKKIDDLIKIFNQLPKTNIDTSSINSIMSKGVSNKITNGDVLRLQKLLKNEGYKIYLDGIFGPGTESALKKFTKDKLGEELNYFDPRLFENKKNISEKNYNPKKMNEYLGYGKFDFFYLNFPFSKSKINSIYCGKAKKDYIFKNNKIIFPISKDGPGKFSCKLNAKLDGKNKTFDIVDVYFRTVLRPTTKVTLTKKYATGPTTETQKRIANERVMLKEIYKKADNSTKFNSPFIKPLDTEMISPFGKIRIFNDGRKSVHSGTDYKAQSPLPVRAINDGVVVLANFDLYYCGKGIIINHGMNIFSTYCHLSENKVSTGDIVKKGDIIGLTGSTGRVSGPHLHLSVKYNGGYVDFEELQKKSEISFR